MFIKLTSVSTGKPIYVKIDKIESVAMSLDGAGVERGSSVRTARDQFFVGEQQEKIINALLDNSFGKSNLLKVVK